MKKTILVIDDEQTTCFLLENFLSKDYQVVTKSSAVEALAWLNTNLPDLIITDIQMPEMSGYDLLEEIRLIGFHMHTPVIMLSANKESKERIKCYQLGAQDYLTKPFNPEELMEITKKNLFPIHYAKAW